MPPKTFRVERFQAPAEDLGEAGRLFDERDRDPGLLQLRRRAAGRDEPDAGLHERAPELGDPGLVVDGNEGAADGDDGGCVGHCGQYSRVDLR